MGNKQKIYIEVRAPISQASLDQLEAAGFHVAVVFNKIGIFDRYVPYKPKLKVIK